MVEDVADNNHRHVVVLRTHVWERPYGIESIAEGDHVADGEQEPLGEVVQPPRLPGAARSPPQDPPASVRTWTPTGMLTVPETARDSLLGVLRHQLVHDDEARLVALQLRLDDQPVQPSEDSVVCRQGLSSWYGWRAGREYPMERAARPLAHVMSKNWPCWWMTSVPCSRRWS